MLYYSYDSNFDKKLYIKNLSNMSISLIVSFRFCYCAVDLLGKTGQYNLSHLYKFRITSKFVIMQV